MSAKNLEIVRAAREWIGTPFHFGSATKHVGCDCIGLLVGVLRELDTSWLTIQTEYALDSSVCLCGDYLQHSLNDVLRRKNDFEEGMGDILLFRFNSRFASQHVGIQSGTEVSGQFIHACATNGVSEVYLNESWKSRILARYTV